MSKLDIILKDLRYRKNVLITSSPSSPRSSAEQKRAPD